VTFENEKGELITEPESNAKFRLPEKEFSRTAGTSWEIASFKVDGTLLARQKVRWFGPDRFLENHGGKDYHFVQGKQRIDFGENEDIYSVFVKVGDTLVWENNRWQVVEPGEDSLGRPLLVVKKVDERLMSFELWDVEGKSKIILNVLKTSEPWTMQNPQVLKSMFKFLGARTRTQSVFEINGERVLLSPSDWLLLTPKGWIKLTDEKEIDDYVKRKLTGTLFIFEGVSRKDDRLAMQGTLYSPSRHEAQQVSLPLQAENKAKPTSKETQDAKEKELKDAKEVADLIGEILAPLNRQDNEVKQIVDTKKPSTAVQTKK
ncbi:MAG: hypothetical protein Q8K60_06645, partial [Parachlamydiaceae bacterium]|nr:hypothetical protein [Parachlamydiaceae bacterium]